MKKISIIVLSLLLVCAFFSSCDNNVTPVESKVATVGFTVADGRGLQELKPDFVPVTASTLVWFYKAEKTSDSNFKTGAAESWTKIGENGKLTNTVVFSLGIWNIDLQAQLADGTIMYEGSKVGVIINDPDNTNKVTINVSASVAGQKGYIVLDDVYILEQNGSDKVAPNVLVVSVSGATSGTSYNLIDNGNGTVDSNPIELAPGSYDVAVGYVSGSIINAGETKTVQVYSGRTTTVTGFVDEMKGEVEFNPVADTGVVTQTVTGGSTTKFTVSNVTPLGEFEKDTTAVFEADALSANGTYKLSTVVSNEIEKGNFSISSNGAVASLDLSLTNGTEVVSTFNDKTVTITTYIAKGLSGVDVTGPEYATITGVNYDSGTGKLDFTTNHFSEYQVTTSGSYAAYNATTNTAYATLQDAFGAVKDNETVVLLKNVEDGAGVNFAQDVKATLDLNRHSYKAVSNGNNTKHRVIIVTKGELTIQNGTLDARNTTDGTDDRNDSNMYGTVRAEGGNVVLKNLTLYNNHDWGMSIKICKGYTGIVENCNVYSKVGGGLEAEGGTIIVRNSIFNQGGSNPEYGYIASGLAVSYGGTVDIYNSGFKTEGDYALYVFSSGGTINVHGGEYKGSKGVLILQQDVSTYPDGISCINVYDGTFEGDIKCNDGEKNKLSIMGGIFSSDPFEYVADGYYVEQNSECKFTVKEAVASVENGEVTTNYGSLSEAIAAVNDIEGEDSVVVSILKSGEYAPFELTRGHVTVQTSDNVIATIKVSSTEKMSLGTNDSKRADCVTLKGINFVTANGTTILYCTYTDSLTLDSCSFINNSNQVGGTALFINYPNIEIKNCTFENWERGYYTCGDNHAAGKMTFTGNMFTNVRAPIDGYWGVYKSSSTDIQITGNTINPGTWGTAYIQLWDYAQYHHYIQWKYKSIYDYTSLTGTALKATVSGNTFNGNGVLYLTHCDWFAASELDISDNSGMTTQRRYLVEVENIPDGATIKLLNADGTDITAFNEKPTVSDRGPTGSQRKAIYAISAGSYQLQVVKGETTTSQEVTIVSRESVVEDNPTQKIRIDNPSV